MSSGSPRTTVMNLTFDGGMDQRTNVRQTQAPQVISATNVRFPENGSVEKRPGTNAVAGAYVGGTGFAAGSGRLLTCRDELLIVDGNYIGTYAKNLGTPFVLKDRVPECNVYDEPVDTAAYSVSQPDVATLSNGLEIHVWAANNNS